MPFSARLLRRSAAMREAFAMRHNAARHAMTRAIVQCGIAIVRCTMSIG